MRSLCAIFNGNNKGVFWKQGEWNYFSNKIEGTDTDGVTAGKSCRRLQREREREALEHEGVLLHLRS